MSTSTSLLFPGKREDTGWLRSPLTHDHELCGSNTFWWSSTAFLCYYAVCSDTPLIFRMIRGFHIGGLMLKQASYPVRNIQNRAADTLRISGQGRYVDVIFCCQKQQLYIKKATVSAPRIWGRMSC